MNFFNEKGQEITGIVSRTHAYVQKNILGHMLQICYRNASKDPGLSMLADVAPRSTSFILRTFAQCADTDNAICEVLFCTWQASVCRLFAADVTLPRCASVMCCSSHFSQCSSWFDGFPYLIYFKGTVKSICQSSICDCIVEFNTRSPLFHRSLEPLLVCDECQNKKHHAPFVAAATTAVTTLHLFATRLHTISAFQILVSLHSIFTATQTLQVKFANNGPDLSLCSCQCFVPADRQGGYDAWQMTLRMHFPPWMRTGQKNSKHSLYVLDFRLPRQLDSIYNTPQCPFN